MKKIDLDKIVEEIKSLIEKMSREQCVKLSCFAARTVLHLNTYKDRTYPNRSIIEAEKFGTSEWNTADSKYTEWSGQNLISFPFDWVSNAAYYAGMVAFDRPNWPHIPTFQRYAKRTINIVKEIELMMISAYCYGDEEIHPKFKDIAEKLQDILKFATSV